MSDLNVWTGQGRLTRDGELRYTPTGQAVMDIGLASNRIFSKDGVRKEKTAFIDITIWGKTAESLAPYLKKGVHITVEGRLEFEEWKNKEDGSARKKLKVTADRVHLSPRNNAGSPTGSPVATQKLDNNEYATAVGGEDDVAF